jgi:DNA end-binding protein Ku
MAARSIGSATISFGLVSIPVKLFTAASAKNVSFNMLEKKTSARLKQQYVSTVTGEVVERDQMVKGYEHSKEKYVTFTEDELKKLEAERTDRLDILEFVPNDSVDPVYYEKTYYLGPDKGGDRAYKLLSNAMVRAGRVAVGKLATRGKEQLVVVRPMRGGLVLQQVYYGDEVRDFGEVERPSDDVTFKPIEEELADRLVEQLSKGTFDATQFRDEYRDRVLAAVEQKVKGEEVTIAAAPPQAQILDLFEALKQSLQSIGPANTTAKAEPASAPALEAADAQGAASQGEEPKPITKAAPARSRAKKSAASS